jgi:hypothetical protein
MKLDASFRKLQSGDARRGGDPHGGVRTVERAHGQLVLP